MIDSALSIITIIISVEWEAPEVETAFPEEWLADHTKAHRSIGAAGTAEHIEDVVERTATAHTADTVAAVDVDVDVDVDVADAVAAAER